MAFKIEEGPEIASVGIFKTSKIAIKVQYIGGCGEKTSAVAIYICRKVA